MFGVGLIFKKLCKIIKSFEKISDCEWFLLTQYSFIAF